MAWASLLAWAPLIGCGGEGDDPAASSPAARAVLAPTPASDGPAGQDSPRGDRDEAPTDLHSGSTSRYGTGFDDDDTFGETDAFESETAGDDTDGTGFDDDTLGETDAFETETAGDDTYGTGFDDDDTFGETDAFERDAPPARSG